MAQEYITKAHYPVYTSDEIELMELHISNYGLCKECSTYSKHVAYPCSIIEAIKKDLA
jgi:hypothetical protein